MKFFALACIFLIFAGCIAPPPDEATPTPTPGITPTIEPTPVVTPTPEPTLSPTPGANATVEYGHKYALVMSGYSGSAQHATWFRGSTIRMHDLLVNGYGFAQDDVYYLFEEKNYSEVDYSATKENLVLALEAIENKSTGSDLVFIYIVGHGNNEGGTGIYSLSDSTLYDYELSALLENVECRQMVIVLTPCNSGAFIRALSREGRIIITSVEPDEGNSAGFAEYVTEGLGNENATLSAVFAHANERVAEWYWNRGIRMPQEHPLLDDNGDGVGHRAPLPNSGDGYVAERVSLNRTVGG